MPFDKTPSTWIEDWSEDGTDITIPIATFPELTDTEADNTTGDIRKVLFAICAALHAKWLATAVADRPARMTIGKRSSVNATTGITTHYFSFDFETVTVEEEVAAE